MSRATPDDQLKFLLNCVKHSNNGKIDFVEVAKECAIVSKGAAAKRYERLMKANGIHPNGGPSDKPPTPAAPREKSKSSTAKVAAAKRRKIEGPSSNIKADEDDDGLRLKPKDEPTDGQHTQPETTLIQPLFPQMLMAATPTLPAPLLISGYGYGIPSGRGMPRQETKILDDCSLFEDFCSPELFEQRTFLSPPCMESAIPIPPAPQEVMMQDLSIQEKYPQVCGSGKELSDSILILD